MCRVQSAECRVQRHVVSTCWSCNLFLGFNPLQPRATIGIALTCDLATTSSQFISQADVAMYVAKLRGKDGVQVYRPEMRDSVIKDLSRHLQGDTISDLELS